MPSAMAVAKRIVELYHDDDDPNMSYATHMHVQKLLYFCQAWSLAIRGENLFAEPIEGWQFGPVVRRVYERLRKFRKNGITPKDLPSHALDRDDDQFVEAIWRAYRERSAVELSKLTHDDRSYRESRVGLGTSDRGATAISTAALAREYGRKTKPAPVAAFARRYALAERKAKTSLAKLPPLSADLMRQAVAKTRLPVKWEREDLVWRD